MYITRTPPRNLENITIASSTDFRKGCNFVLFQNISLARPTRKQSQFERASNGGTGMSDEKPMTVKERMAALARANSAPAAGPPKPGVASSGTSVADRLAKMRHGGSSPQGNSQHPVRSQGGGSSIADRIAKLSGSNNELGSGTTKPAAGVSAGSTTTKSGQVFKSAGPSAVDGGNNSVKASSGGTGRSPKPGGVGLPGMARAIPIPMPGAMPAGGLAELKRRKQEAEKAASGGTEKESTAPTAVAGKSAEDERPGELQHANLSRATIPQRRRPRKATRPFKATTAAASDATSAAVKAPRPATVAAAAAPPTEQPPSISISESQAVTTTMRTSKTDASTEFSSTNAVDAVGKMKSMLQAAAKADKQEDAEDGDDDADWE